MSNHGKHIRRGAVVFFTFVPARWHHLPVLIGALLLALTLPARALEADEWYMQTYNTIERADTLAQSGQAERAKAKYLEAEKALKELKQNYPTYNSKLVATRLVYLAEKIDALSKPAPVAPAMVAGEGGKKTTPPVAAKPGEPEVKLIDAGAEPRKTYRIQAKAGDTQKATMTVRMSMTMAGPNMPANPIKMPAIKISVIATTKTISAEGDINYELQLEGVDVVSEAGVIPQMAEAMKESFKDVKGLTITGTITDRGISKKIEAKIPAGVDSQKRESLEQMKEFFSNAAFVLPEEAVGMGAKWEVKEKIKAQGMMIDQLNKLELVSAEGDVLAAKNSITQSAANQKIANPLIPTLKVDMTKMTGTATGSATVNMARLLPVKLAFDDHSEINMAMNAGGKKQALTMKTDTNVSFEGE